MKKLYTILAVILITLTVWGQSPEKMSYQAIIRDADNNLVVNQNVGMQISILQSSETGTPVYVETQSPTTNANGLITIEIGEGTSTDDFSAIDWSDGPYFVKTEIDPDGNTDYTITGTSQLLSVPYALYAKSAGNVAVTGDEASFAGWDKDVSDDFDGQYSSLTGAPANVSDLTNDAGYLTAEVDGSVTNEIQVISISNDTIYLSNGGFVKLPASSSFSGSYNDLTDVPVNMDTDKTDDFDGQYNSLTGAPANVSDFTNDAGYLTAEVDGSITNEIELPVQTGHNGEYLTTNGSSVSWAAVGGSSSASYAYIKMTGNGTMSGPNTGGTGYVTGSEVNFGAGNTPTSLTDGLAWNNSTQEITVATTGVYEIELNAMVEFIYSDYWDAYNSYKIYVNGSPVYTSPRLIMLGWGSLSEYFNHNVNYVGSLTAGDVIKVTFYYYGQKEATRLATGSTLTVKSL